MVNPRDISVERKRRKTASSFSVWQHVNLSKQTCPLDTVCLLPGCSATNKQQFLSFCPLLFCCGWHSPVYFPRAFFLSLISTKHCFQTVNINDQSPVRSKYHSVSIFYQWLYRVNLCLDHLRLGLCVEVVICMLSVIQSVLISCNNSSHFFSFFFF